MVAVDAFLIGLDSGTRPMIDRLRAIAAAAHPALAERIKWNAPSFALSDDDLITLGVERKGGVRLVLHRRARPSAAGNFSFEDPDGLARWPAPDRGVAVFRDLAAIDRVADRLALLCRRWVEQIDSGRASGDTSDGHAARRS